MSDTEMPTAAAPAVAFQDVTVTFPRHGRAVLHGATFTINAGERVVLFGPSGAGKSTLLATIAAVVPHSVIARVTGSVTVAGLDTLATEVVELSRHLGVLPQDPDSAVCLPGVEHELAFVLENRAVAPPEISARIDSALAVVGAGALRGRQTGSLSGGESQRVALAAALIGRPDILVLDEPTSMLDADGLRQVREAIDAAARPGTVAVLLVEHRLDEYAGSRGVAGLPERCIVLGSDGRITHDGPTASVLPTAAVDLHRAGCWLPGDIELQAALGLSGGLAAPEVQRALLALAGEGCGAPEVFGPVVLAGHDLAVSRDAAPRTLRRRPWPFRRAAQRSGGGRAEVVGRAEVRRVLVRGVNVELRAGEIVAVLGRNGAGKSSLLLTLAGLLAPAGGTVTGARPGLVFQNPEHQFLGSTVREEIAVGLPAGCERVDRVLTAYGLGPLADRNPYRLSGGQKRTVSLAAMLVHERPSLLADEPTLGLDRRSTIATIAAFRRAARDGRGILVCSHDLRTVAILADRVLVVADGRIVADGSVVEVLRQGDLLARAGITVPPLLRWLVARLDSGAQVRRVLDALDATVGVRASGGDGSGSEDTAGSADETEESPSITGATGPATGDTGIGDVPGITGMAVARERAR
ncbi:ABC transporter ATP-binding protein [Cryobacterium sp. PAMC25264]|uniref:ABC transporter ATP-binding protein n=1 Tax=Cryobacterium sp. PAMC25264 TaxID=2861288 RepID=UPI001C635762|nr:ABC transporter ATP-binding protein [Cryobacterium sp. PAMC25264]QYF72898.1 ATP-binding cassette domain-containing protein [Cryobacterium sp. PAMC25264]